MSTAAAPPVWRDYLYLGRDHRGDYMFAAPVAASARIPARGRLLKVTVSTLDHLPPGAVGVHGAAKYWAIRDQWRGWPDEELAAFCRTWLPRRDAILAKDTYANRARSEWERFYVALADEQAARALAEAEIGLSYGLDAGALLSALAAAGKPYELPLKGEYPPAPLPEREAPPVPITF